jgi:hypothetical protein
LSERCCADAAFSCRSIIDKFRSETLFLACTHRSCYVCLFLSMSTFLKKLRQDSQVILTSIQTYGMKIWILRHDGIICKVQILNMFAPLNLRKSCGKR